MTPRRLAACLLLLLGGCAAAPRQPPPPPSPPGAPEVRAVRVRETIIVDGVDNDAGWRECPETEVPLEGKGPPSCRVKAAVYRGTIFFCLRWRDATRSAGIQVVSGPPSWHWARGLGDSLGLTFPIVGPILDPADPSIPRLLDHWEWSLGWAEVNGNASDYVLVNSTDGLDRDVWGPWPSGLSMRMDEVGSAASNSRDDIKGCGRWKDGAWTVEVARALSTGHADDRDLSDLCEIPFQIVILDKGDGHTEATMGGGTSPVLRLLLPPPEDARQGPLPEPLGPPEGGR